MIQKFFNSINRITFIKRGIIIICIMNTLFLVSCNIYNSHKIDNENAGINNIDTINDESNISMIEKSNNTITEDSIYNITEKAEKNLFEKSKIIFSSDSNEEYYYNCYKMMEEINKKPKIGDTVRYGINAYDYSDYKRDIVDMMEWRVIDIKDNNALLITTGIIMNKTYNKDDENGDWEKSKIRDICDTAFDYIFSEHEREGIIETTLVTNDKETKDKIFILSLEEIIKYYGDNDKQGMNLNAISIAQKNAIEEGMEIRTDNDSEYYGAGSYWLRDVVDDNKAMWVGQYGHIYRDGYDKNEKNGIRFAIWVNMDYLTYDKVVEFGTFEQDNILENGKEKIKWDILDIDKNRIKLLSKNILFNMKYNDKSNFKDYLYYDSLIRKRLVNDFYKDSFNKNEKELMCDIEYDLENGEHNAMTGTIYKYENIKKEKFTDKIIILSKEEYKKYLDDTEKYSPPDNFRYDFKFTEYAKKNKQSLYVEDFLDKSYKSTNNTYWLRDILVDTIQYDHYVAKTINDRGSIIYANLTASYGVRPYIELDLTKIKNEANKYDGKYLPIDTTHNENDSDISYENNNKYIKDDDIMFSNKYDNIIAYFYDYVLNKYNLIIDTKYYDINNNNIVLLARSNNGKYNKYTGLLEFEYELEEDNFPKNINLINQYDITSVSGHINEEENNYIITNRNYNLTLFKILNPNYLYDYERLLIKSEILNKYKQYRKKGIIIDENDLSSDDEVWTVFSTYVTKNIGIENLTGIPYLEVKDGKNEYEIERVYKNKINRYKLIVDVKMIDEENYYIEDINYEYIKSYNRSSHYIKGKQFGDSYDYDFNAKYVRILNERNKKNTIQKKITTLEELVEANNKLLKQIEIDENEGDVMKLPPAYIGQDIYEYNNFDDSQITFDVIKFGKYKNKPIEWYVLSNENNKKLLISKYIIDVKKFTDKNFLSTWEDCSLREWLNNDFYNEAFSNKEKNKIIDVNIKSLANEEEYDCMTKDKIFLLSYNEYEKFFGKLTNANVNPYGSAYPTEYAKNLTVDGKRLFVEDKDERYSSGYQKSSYWLRDRIEANERSSYNDNDYVDNVSEDGQVLSDQFFNVEKAGVRPVIVINENIDKNINEDAKSNIETKKDTKDNGAIYKYLLTLGNKDVYIDLYTNIFVFVDGNKINLGKIVDTTYPYDSLLEIDEYCKNDYYFDEENELLYFRDYSEKSYGYSYNNSLCVVDKNITKTKIAEDVTSYKVLKDCILYTIEGKVGAHLIKNDVDEVLKLENKYYNIIGNNGDDYCYIAIASPSREKWYIYKNGNLKKTIRPEEYK